MASAGLLSVSGNTTNGGLVVKDMQASPMDLSASRDERLDLNRQPCALVKVWIVGKDVKFEGNVVGEPVCRNNEYWVYLCGGTKMMKILHPQTKPLMVDFGEYGIDGLLPQMTYILDVDVPATVMEDVSAVTAVATSSTNEPETGSEASHVVVHKLKSGETLYDVAQKYGLDLQTLAEANNVGETQVYPGTTLVIPPSSKSAEEIAREREILAMGKAAEEDDDYVGAFRLYSQIPENPTAQYNLSQLYYLGRGVKENTKKYVELLRSAAAAGNPEAMEELGDALLDGEDVRKNVKQGIKWYERAALQGGDMAIRDLAEIYEEYDDELKIKLDFKTSLGWWMLYSRFNPAVGYYRMGRLYLKGGHGLSKDLAKAVDCFERSVDNGGTDALEPLAGLYGKDGEAGYKPARLVELYQKLSEAAKNRQDEAKWLFELGKCYYYGIGIARDEAKARDLIVKAAWNNSDAQAFCDEHFPEDY